MLRWQRPRSGRRNIRGAYTGASADLSISTTKRRRVPRYTKCAHCSRQGTVPPSPSPVQPVRWSRRPRQWLQTNRTLTSSSSSFPLLSWTLVDLQDRPTGPSGSVLLECPRTQDPKPDYLSKTADFAGPVFPGITYLTSVIPVISGTPVASGVRSPKCSPGQRAERRLTRWRSSTSGTTSVPYSIGSGRPSPITYRRRTPD